MTIDRDTLLFFDASCLIAAAGSPNGGSGFLLSVCGRGFLKAVVSQPVLLEAERNILENFGSEALHGYHRLIVLTPMKLVPVPSHAERFPYQNIVGQKDEHVVAAASAVDAAFLLTLDKKLAMRVNQAELPCRALSPGDFIKTALPDHVDYRRIR